MTESEWLACTDPTPMLEFLRGKASDRKLRLLAAAGGRADWAEGNGLPGDYSIYFGSFERAADSGNVEDWIEETPSAARWYSPLDMAFLWLGTDPSPARSTLIRDIF